MLLKPLFDRLLVRPLSSEQEIGGLLLPDTSINLKKGVVVAAGDGKPGVPMTVSENQVVYFKKDDGFPVTLEGEQLLVLVERDIWLVI